MRVQVSVCLIILGGGPTYGEAVALDMAAGAKNMTVRTTPAIKSTAAACRATTIAAGYPRAMLDFAVSMGADRQTLLQRSGLVENNLADQDSHVPIFRYVTLIEAAAELTREPGIALQFGKAVRMQEI